MEPSSPQPDNPKRWLKFLKFGFSVLCGIVCLMLIVLWVRSYWYLEELPGSTSIERRFRLYSVRGRVEWYSWNVNRSNEMPLGVLSDSGEMLVFPGKRNERPQLPDFQFLNDGTFTVLIVPYWFLVLTVAALTAAPWLPYRFSLRTLLIATTVIAVVLGAIIYASR